MRRNDEGERDDGARRSSVNPRLFHCFWVCLRGEIFREERGELARVKRKFLKAC